MNKELQEAFEQLFQTWSGEALVSMESLPKSGSDRQYFRLRGAKKEVLAAHNSSEKENNAFIAYTKHFKEQGIALPAIYAENLEQNLYFLQDLGNTTLLAFLEQHRKGTTIDKKVIDYYKVALAQLAFMQIKGGEGLKVEDFHTPAQFGEQGMLWDVQYFKYCFLKTTKIEYNDYDLEQDFQTLTGYLASETSSFFMFRDFQARNIMICDDQPYFIDYQGGMRGPLQYDVVSLLFQAKANLPNTLREELLEHYIAEALKHTSFDKDAFRSKYYAFVLIRTLQVLGAYGFKGLYERKAHFLASIPYALRNLDWWLKHVELPIEIPHLKAVLAKMVEKELPKERSALTKSDRLTVRIQSFSYKRGIPEDPSGNGGGFVFDCRFIHNPGRYQPYKTLTGRDQPVIDFFKEQSTIHAFVKKVENIVEEAVENYIERGFASLCINFGCTGGQHRSVFSADYIAQHLQNKYPVDVVLYHREQERKNWKN